MSPHFNQKCLVCPYKIYDEASLMKHYISLVLEIMYKIVGLVASSFVVRHHNPVVKPVICMFLY